MNYNFDYKVYSFSLKNYRRFRSRKVIANTISFIIICSVLILLFYVVFKTTPMVAFFCTIFLPLIIIASSAKLIFYYLNAAKIYKNDYVKIIKNNNIIIGVEISLTGYKYKKEFRIKKITQVCRKGYIDIQGDIKAEFIIKKTLLKDSSSTFADLRLYPNFENMDELYSELKKMKEHNE